MKLNSMQKTVLDVINKYPGIQNSDAFLVAAVWREKGWDDSQPLEENIRIMPRSESITRRRRELHQMGLITYSQKADEARQEAFKNERELHSSFLGRIFGGRH